MSAMSIDSDLTPKREAPEVPAEQTNGHDKNAPLDFTKFYNVIDGKLTTTEKTRHTINPSTLEENPEVPISTQEDVDKAVAAAKRAEETWSQVPWAKRREAIEGFATALEALDKEFADILVKEMGIPLSMAIHEVNWGVEWLRDTCKLELQDKVIDDAPGRRVVERYTPIGVGVGIVPWNGPVILSCGKIGPALLTGNTLILKPSPYAPYSIPKMAELGLQFFPPGVLQALNGTDDLGPKFTAHNDVGKISFTGSGAVAKKVMAACGQSLKRVSLELGGNDPAIVCPDVDPKVVAAKVAGTALLRSGQLCMAVKRVYVHESIYDEVLHEIVNFVNTIKVGDGFTDGVMVGPLSNKAQYDRVAELLKDLDGSGLNIASRGTGVDGLKGYFVSPVVVADPPDDARVVVEEPFGPIIPVMKWSDEADVIRRANDTDYGLGASVWSRDIEQASRIANRLQAGNVWVNTHAELQASTAFACTKQSGFGSELGIDGLKNWCNVQAVYVRTEGSG